MLEQTGSATMGEWLKAAKQWARSVKRDVVALWIAAHDVRTPVVAKIVAGAIAAYALSPVDLIPDFVPVLGYLDDLIIVPIGILIAIRLIPAPLMSEFRDMAIERVQRPVSRAGLVAVVIIWLLAAALCIWLARDLLLR
ncbi:YkvA family protein [Rhizobium sp. 1399]|uniref:YkvA family protein n=1 Tax=Rhizobium sp. 1399 TaxID=2817758 RepID=UPI0028542E00|nr:uncharacterized membrane protein YkvA (DUF1232 family) [Rhizobium sp. 1399]